MTDTQILDWLEANYTYQIKTSYLLNQGYKNWIIYSSLLSNPEHEIIARGSTLREAVWNAISDPYGKSTK